MKSLELGSVIWMFDKLYEVTQYQVHGYDSTESVVTIKAQEIPQGQAPNLYKLHGVPGAKQENKQ